MRQDQFERLQALEEKLADVFITEAEPEHWPGHGITPGSMDQQTRGDRYWCKKNAVATLSLISRVGSLIGQVQALGAGTTPAAAEGAAADAEASSLDAEVQQAEKEAAKLLDQMQRASRKGAFDNRVHGS